MATREHYGLRSMTDDDLNMVFRWRNSEQVRPFMYTTHEISEREHLAWWARVKDDPAKCYLVFEVDGRPIGLSNIVAIDPLHGTASWGFYIGEEWAPKGSGGRLGILALDKAFDGLGLSLISERKCSAATTMRAAAFMREWGFRRRAARPARRRTVRPR